MKNIWNDAEAYQRTSKNLQFEYLKKMLSKVDSAGSVLDVGCGTGNAISIMKDLDLSVDYYLGIDISEDMIALAKEKADSTKYRFEVADFLEFVTYKEKEFDLAICAACLHWFNPRQDKVIEKINNQLKVDGTLILSCAYNFEILDGEEKAQRSVLEKLRSKYDCIGSPETFNALRYGKEDIIRIIDGFNLLSIETHEEKLSFESFDDFRDWHVGSGSVIKFQFSEKDREIVLQEYYSDLYDLYCQGEYEVCYSTSLLKLKKKSFQRIAA